MAPGGSDTAAVLAALQPAAGSPSDVPAVLAAVEGPWAALFWRPAAGGGGGGSLWFGRDPMGRRSLLLGQPEESSAGAVLLICSVAPASARHGWRWLGPGLPGATRHP